MRLGVFGSQDAVNSPSLVCMQISATLYFLPVPGHPWSHVALDFVTSLPPSHGNTVILTVVDCFSKAVHFIALPKVPTGRETADLVVTCVPPARHAC